MARAPIDPSASASALDPTAGAAGGGDMSATDPTAGADASDSVIVTICRDPAGGYVVYSGDEPDASDGTSADDDAASGGASAGGASGGDGGGQHVDSIGAALKAAMDVLQEDASSQGAAGSSDDQFASGFAADQSPTPAASKPSRQKYPAGA
jgi:hypothetical protein